MAPSRPTIQSFFEREVPPRQQRIAAPLVPGDGFTEEELAVALDPLMTKFHPTREYKECNVASIVPGPNAVTFKGRIVNFSTHLGKSKTHSAAKGWHHLVLKDDTGAVCVKLYFARQPYPLKLGLLLTVWTSFISKFPASNNFKVPNALIATNIFPGRDSSVHLLLHSSVETGYRTPLEYTPGRELPGLMTLRSFITGGYEVADSKILVCVKSIGAKKAITTKQGKTVELLEVAVFDDTADAVLELWDIVASTAKEWRPSGTVLLISRPGFRFENKGRGSLRLTHSTFVDVDPEFSDANWLKAFASMAHRAESMKQDFPEGVFDMDAALNGVYRILFNIADIDDWVRANSRQTFTGFLSLTIMEMCLALNHKRNMLLCTECCGVPIYANTPKTQCKNCDKDLHLAMNPKAVGMLLDETGCIGPGKLLWRPSAWEDLFGRSVEELATYTNGEMRLLEQRMLFMRVTFVFGWSHDVEKLAVLAVRM